MSWETFKASEANNASKYEPRFSTDSRTATEAYQCYLLFYEIHEAEIKEKILAKFEKEKVNNSQPITQKKENNENPNLTKLEADIEEIKQKVLAPPTINYDLVPRHRELSTQIEKFDQAFEANLPKIEKVKEHINNPSYADIQEILTEQLQILLQNQLDTDTQRQASQQEKENIEKNVEQYITYAYSPQTAQNPAFVQIREFIEANQWEAATQAIDIAALNRRKIQYSQVEELLHQQKQYDAQQYKQYALQLLIDKPTDWFTAAYEALKNATELTPSYTSLFEFALFLQQHNQFDEATKYCQRALRLVIDDAKKAATLNNLGNLHRAKNRHEEALACYEEALEIYRRLARPIHRPTSLT